MAKNLIEWNGTYGKLMNDILKQFLKLYEMGPLGRPQTRWKDAEEKDIQKVDGNVELTQIQLRSHKH